MFANNVKETTATTGTGTVTLAAVAGSARGADAFAVGDLVPYGIRSGDDWEWGIGTVGATNTLARTTINATFVAGVYNKATPTAITLAGTSTVIVTPHADAVSAFDHAHAASGVANTPAGNIAATNVQAAINELDAEKQPIDATLTAIADETLGAFSHRNKIINGNFAVNQRAVTGTVTLAAGAYGHDRWKAGAGGCTYTFATSANVTTLTISAGTLMQVIEGENLLSGTHVLTWTGTATARVDSGSYSASGMTGTAVGGINQTIEFATGTVSKVQYEPGSVATPFEHRPIGTELALCQRYAFVFGSASAIEQLCNGSYYATTLWLGVLQFPVPMRSAPTLTYSGSFATEGSGASFAVSSLSLTRPSTMNTRIDAAISGATIGYGATLNATAGAKMVFSAEL
jgi:hypothetical protein